MVFKQGRVESYQTKSQTKKMNNRHFTVALAAISVQAISLKETYPIAGGEGTGTPQQELSVELNDLAQVDARDYLGFGTHTHYCARYPMDAICNSESSESESDKTETDDEPWLNESFWGFDDDPSKFA